MATSNYFASNRTSTEHFQIVAALVIQCFWLFRQLTWLKCYNNIPVFSKDVWNDNRKGVSCRWQICFEIIKYCHSWTSIQKKGKILQIPLQQWGIHKLKTRQDLYVLNWKSSYDVLLFTCQNRQHFVWFLGPGIYARILYVIWDLRKGCGFIFPVCFLYRLSRFPIHECLFILCIVYLSLCTFYRGVSWNSCL
jgi:hypothetical protein